MGPEPSVLLAISQRNMWVKKEDHACTSSGPLLIRGSAGHTFPRVAGIRRFVRQCSRNNDNDWQRLGEPEGGLTGAECNGAKLRLAQSFY